MVMMIPVNSVVISILIFIVVKLFFFVGTGKTLVARALANECSQGDKKVAFFMRKGADCLSKWVGESERQLRLLFDQVMLHCKMLPSLALSDNISMHLSIFTS